jgi:hypothetical protein
MRDAKAAYSSAVDDQAVAVGELAAASSLRDWSRDPQAPYKLRAGPVVPIAFDATDPVLILDVIAALRQVIEPPQPKPFPSPSPSRRPCPRRPRTNPSRGLIIRVGQSRPYGAIVRSEHLGVYLDRKTY